MKFFSFFSFVSFQKDKFQLRQFYQSCGSSDQKTLLKTDLILINTQFFKKGNSAWYLLLDKKLSSPKRFSSFYLMVLIFSSLCLPSQMKVNDHLSYFLLSYRKMVIFKGMNSQRNSSTYTFKTSFYQILVFNRSSFVDIKIP